MKNKEYLKAHLQESFQTIDTCLTSIYNDEAHMYRSLSGQLRILLSDKKWGKENSLLYLLHPDVRIRKLQEVEWGKKAAFVRDRPNSTNRYSIMPYEITEYANGLAVGDFLFTSKSEFLSIPEWLDQFLTFTPTPVTIRNVLKGVADKGGGAHIDIEPSYDLSQLYKSTPTGHTYAELFIIALARLTQGIGEKILGYEGCKVPEKLVNQKQNKYTSMLAAHVELADFYKEMKPKS